jgi:hypothetical protein
MDVVSWFFKCIRVPAVALLMLLQVNEPLDDATKVREAFSRINQAFPDILRQQDLQTDTLPRLVLLAKLPAEVRKQLPSTLHEWSDEGFLGELEKCLGKRG